MIAWLSVVTLGLGAFLSACRGPDVVGEVGATTDPQRLAADLAPLKHWYASAAGGPRALALLSPT